MKQYMLASISPTARVPGLNFWRRWDKTAMLSSRSPGQPVCRSSAEGFISLTRPLW